MVTHKLQARESSPVRDRRSTTELHHKLSQSYISQVVQFVLRNIRESQRDVTETEYQRQPKTDLWNMWIELNRAMYRFNSVHLGRTQTALGRNIDRKPTPA